MINNIAVCVNNGNKNVTAKETIDAIYNAGFKNVFIQYYNKDIEELSEIEQINYCKELGLNIIFSHLGYKNLRNINAIWLEDENGEKVIDGYIEDFKVMKENNIDLVVMHLTSGNEPPMYNEIGLKRIKRLVKSAKELEIKIAFENTKKQGYLEYILGNIKEDNVGICYDAGHCHAHFNDKFNYEFFKDRIFTVHLHDNDKSDDLHLLPFDGTIEWNNVLTKLKENNYTGPITLELCYRYDYLNQPIEEFYKEGYNRGIKLEEIYKSIETRRIKET